MAVLRSPHGGLPPGPSREDLEDEPSLEDIIFSLGLELGGPAVDGEGSGGDTSSTNDPFRPQRLSNSFGHVLSPPSGSPIDADVFLSKPLPSQDGVETSLGARVLGGNSVEVTRRKGTQQKQPSTSEEPLSLSSHQPSRLLSRFYDDLRKKNPELFDKHDRSSIGESPVSPRSDVTSPRSEFTVGNHGSETDSRGRRRAGSLARSDSGHSVAESHSSRGSDESRMSLKERLEKNKQNMQQLLSRQPFPPKGLSRSRENLMANRGRSESDPFSERREVMLTPEFRTAGNSLAPRQTPSPNQRTVPSPGLRQSASSSDLPARGHDRLPHTPVPAADLQQLRLARTRSPDSHHDSAVDMDSVSLQSGQGPTEQSSEGLSNGSEPYHYHRGYHTADSDADSGISRPHRPAVQRSTHAASSPDESDPSTRHRGNHRVRERPLSANHREALRLLQQARSKATPLKADHSIRPVVARPKDSPHGIDSYLQQGARPKNGILQNGNSGHLIKSGHGSDRENYPPGNNHSPNRTSRKNARNGETARVRFMDDVGVSSDGDVQNGVVDGPLGALTREGDARVMDRENRRNRKQNGSHSNHPPSPWSERNGALIHEEIIQTDNFILPDTYIGSSPEGSDRQETPSPRIYNTPSPRNHYTPSPKNQVHNTPSPRNQNHNVQVQVHSSSQSDSTISNGSLSSHGRVPRPSSRTDRHSPSAKSTPTNQRPGSNGHLESYQRQHRKSPDVNGTYRSSSASPSNISIEDPYESVDLDNGRSSRNSRQSSGLQDVRDRRAQDENFLRTSYVGVLPDSLKTSEPQYATVDKTRKQRRGKERPESAKSAGSSSSSNPCVVGEVDVGIESIEKPKEKTRGNTRDLAGFPDEDLRSSRSSLFDRMQSFGKVSKKKLHSLRRAVSMQALDRPNQAAEPEAKLKKAPSLMSLKKTPSLRSLTNLSFRRKKDIDRSRQYMVEDDLHRDTKTRSSDRRRPSRAKSDNVSSGSKHPSPPKRPSSARGEQDLDTSSVSSPGHFRTIGRLVKMMPDNTQVIELIKPPHGPFGFYIARGNEKYNHGLFVSRLSDGYPDKLFAGLLGLGDEILEINGVPVNTITLDDVYDLMAETKEKLVLRVLPLLARNDW
ncbi:PARD6A [Branchiostoma lanceolatum]|uniref:PARD6A protein n=1 Tax=Branchiostoma lanceolatum TaxID=7740 RepID=A0A8K0EZB8_BRALA|nr:PARD6A [Branchiostoma lanceolatum]